MGMSSNTKRRFLIIVTPHKRDADEFIRHNYPGVRVDDVMLILNRDDLRKIMGMEIDFNRVHFLRDSFMIKNAKEEIMVRVRNNPVGEPLSCCNQPLKEDKVCSSCGERC
jgi:hypothetical protein